MKLILKNDDDDDYYYYYLIELHGVLTGGRGTTIRHNTLHSDKTWHTKQKNDKGYIKFNEYNAKKKK
jgi:hypothetical protein